MPPVPQFPIREAINNGWKSPAVIQWHNEILDIIQRLMAGAVFLDNPSRAVETDAANQIVASAVTAAELNGLDGLTASRAVITDGSGILDTSATTSTELGYVSGVTSAIQTQINGIHGGNDIEDMRVTTSGFDRPGISDPALVAYAPGGGATTSYLYEFKKNDIASFVVQVPHEYGEGGNLSVHLHWTPGTRGAAESGATVGWKVHYSWANIDGTFGAMGTADLSDACDGTDHKHQMTPVVAITGTGKTVSSMLICNVTRTDTGADDTWASAVSGQLPLLLEIDFHYTLRTVG